MIKLILIIIFLILLYMILKCIFSEVTEKTIKKRKYHGLFDSYNELFY